MNLKLFLPLALILSTAACSNPGSYSTNAQTSPSPTPSPTPSPSPTPTPTPSPTPGPGTGVAQLTWEAPNQNMDDSCLTDLSGYNVHYGTQSGTYNYSQTVMVNGLSCSPSGTSNVCGNILTCTYTVNGLGSGTWYFALDAFNSTGDVSGYSNVASKVVE